MVLRKLAFGVRNYLKQGSGLRLIFQYVFQIEQDSSCQKYSCWGRMFRVGLGFQGAVVEGLLLGEGVAYSETIVWRKVFNSKYNVFISYSSTLVIE